MTKILLYSLVNIVLFIAISETASYGSDKFSKYYNQAIEHYKHGKYDQAGDQFEKALELKPSDAYALYGLGNTYYCKAKYDEAIKIYTKAIGINPDYAKVHYSLSLAYNKMGMTREAEKEKKIFRKISQGGKGSEKAQAHKERTSRTPVKVSAHTGKEEHGRSEFGLTGTKHAEPADFGRSGYDQKTQEHKKAADTDKHDLSTKHTLVSKGAHTFGSKRGHPDARLKGHSTGSTHAAHETHSSGTKQDHGKAESHGGAEHDTHKAAAHGAEAAHDAGGGAHHDAGHDTGHDAGGVAHRDTGHDDGGVAHRDTGHDDGGVAHHDTGHDAGGVVHHDAGHDAGAGAHQKEHTPDKHVTSTHGTKKHLKKEETHSIFQGYTKESSKSKSHIFSKKHGKSLGSGIRPVVYVKSKWAESGINKIAMSVICYIFVTQMWLSVIAFFGFIVWRIKQKNLPG